MQMLHHTKTLGIIQVDESVWKKLTWEKEAKNRAKFVTKNLNSTTKE